MEKEDNDNANKEMSVGELADKAIMEENTANENEEKSVSETSEQATNKSVAEPAEQAKNEESTDKEKDKESVSELAVQATNEEHIDKEDEEKSVSEQAEHEEKSVSEPSEQATKKSVSEMLEEQEMLRVRLFPIVQSMFPSLAPTITGMLLQLTKSDLLYLLENHSFLKAKVEEAVYILREQKGKLEKRLIPLIQSMAPDQAVEITGILFQRANVELEVMLMSRDILVVKVAEAETILRERQVRMELYIDYVKYLYLFYCLSYGMFKQYHTGLPWQLTR